MTVLEQFKNFLENHISNPEIEQDERMFNSYTDVKEDSIFLKATCDGKELTFEYNCYFSGSDYDLYNFQLYDGAFV